MEEIADNSHLHLPGNWYGIWRFKVPPKVKNLIWIVCRGCLPTRARLLDREVNCSQVQVEQFVTILWSLWKSRNILVWQNGTETCQSILERGRQLLIVWKKVNSSMQQSGVVGNGVGTHIPEHMLAVREDAKKVVDYYNRGSNDISEFGAIINECRRKQRAFEEKERPYNNHLKSLS
ncbi:hypothetical protein MTR_8g037330 [Medicago truncatula]|uniref:Reverse transcriptase zinc-binding domain-containing protein n=1 Tax=Medicago truncatula TaxID=3880 RepID=A0A072TPF1_MEDTR|nr:hypothetical protein MTR_8g037330 [Medicago truncatula]